MRLEFSAFMVEEKVRLTARIQKLKLEVEEINKKIFEYLFTEETEE